MKKRFTIGLLSLLTVAGVNAADKNVPYNSNTGYADIEDALKQAQPGDVIRIEVGTYIAGITELVIPAGVTVIGGYPNGSFDDADRIYPGAATSYAEMTILDGNSLMNTKPSEKHRVATVKGTLEGVMIRNGHARGSASDGTSHGGGVYVDGGIVQNCIIKGNVAMDVVANGALGGGAYLSNNARLLNCVVAFNMANNGYGIAGTGEVINNTITANTYAPYAVAVAGGSYEHYAHWNDANSVPAPITYDTQTIDITDFSLSQTQTTTSQYAVFAAAMDLKVDESTQQVSFSDASLKLSDLIDPLQGVSVGSYMGFTSIDADFLFANEGQDNYGMQQIGTDFIYYASRQNETMTFVNWHGALAYSLWVGGTLPTEGQWEFAARSNGSGTLDAYLYAGSSDLSSVSWYNGNSGNRVKEVATKSANGIGLYDMTGNVWEWCADKYEATGNKYPTYGSTTDPIYVSSGSGRVLRGGNWNSDNGYQALAFRFSYIPANVSSVRGFRPVLVP